MLAALPEVKLGSNWAANIGAGLCVGLTLCVCVGNKRPKATGSTCGKL